VISEENVKSKSLSLFINEDHKSLNLKGLRCSLKPYIDQGWMENIPLYAVEAYLEKTLNKNTLPSIKEIERELKGQMI
jgi:hypothetical protein